MFLTRCRCPAALGRAHIPPSDALDASRVVGRGGRYLPAFGNGEQLARNNGGHVWQGSYLCTDMLYVVFLCRIFFIYSFIFALLGLSSSEQAEADRLTRAAMHSAISSNLHYVGKKSLRGDRRQKFFLFFQLVTFFYTLLYYIFFAFLSTASHFVYLFLFFVTKLQFLEGICFVCTNVNASACSIERYSAPRVLQRDTLGVMAPFARSVHYCTVNRPGFVIGT